MTRRAILLHGYGGDGAELMQAFASPGDAGFTCLAPDAPNRCDLVPGKRQWFALTRLPAVLAERVPAAAEALVARLSPEWGEAPLLIGHSQGAMIAAHLVLSGRLPGARAVCVAGLLSGIAPADARLHDRLVFVHGVDDEMIPLAELEAQLAGVERTTKLVRVAGSGHPLDPAIVAAATAAARDLVRL